MWHMRMFFFNEIATHSKHTKWSDPNNCGVLLLGSACLYYTAHMPCDDSALQIHLSMWKFLCV